MLKWMKKDRRTPLPFHTCKGKEIPDRPENPLRARQERFYLWFFIAQEGLYEEARCFIEESMDKMPPFLQST